MLTRLGKPFAGFVILMVCSTRASADYIDTFESYTNTFDLFALGAWGDFNAFPTTGVELRTSGGHPGQYVYHPAGPTMRHELIPPVSTSADQSIVWEFDFLVEAGTTPWNKRITNGLRVEGTTTILEMGIHNSNLDPETGGTTSGYAIRTVSIGGTPNNWVCFPPCNFGIHLGWHHFRATIKPTQILFELDFEADGVFDTSRLVITNDTSGIAWNSLRIGGPSDLSSPWGGAGFDNVSVRLVPVCLADIAPPAAGDGVVNIDDLLSVIGGWGACPGACPPYCTADVNHNCIVNIDDLLAVINAWGPCR